MKKNQSLHKTIDIGLLLLLTSSLASLLQAGLPLFKCLLILVKQFKQQKLEEVVRFLSSRVYAGFSLSSSLAYYPKIFDKVYIALIKAGEESGKLQDNLAYLAQHLKRIHKTKKTLKAALLYPAVVLGIAGMVLGVIILWVVPRFELVFKSTLGQKSLPKISQLLMDFSFFMRHNFFIVVAFLGGFIFLGTLLLKKLLRSGQERLLHIPIVGTLALHMNLAFFSYTLAILLKSGISLLDAIRLSKTTFSLDVFHVAFKKVEEQVKNGTLFSKALERQSIFPDTLCNLIQIGEESGNLVGVLESFSKMYQEKTEDALKKITTLFEPILILFLAIIIGGIILALFLPMLDFIQALS